mgnify:FL=1
MYRESSGKSYTYTMCILKHSRSCEVKGMAEVRDVETRRETISGIIGAYERDFATYPDVLPCSADRYFGGVYLPDF